MHNSAPADRRTRTSQPYRVAKPAIMIKVRPPRPHHAPNHGARPRAIHIAKTTRSAPRSRKAVVTVRTLATRAAPAPEFSAQIPQPKTEKQQVDSLRLPRTPNREPSQDGLKSCTSRREPVTSASPCILTTNSLHEMIVDIHPAPGRPTGMFLTINQNDIAIFPFSVSAGTNPAPTSNPCSATPKIHSR